MNLEEEVKRCKNGEKEAFCELFQSVESKALTTAYFLCGDKNMAEDILQETYLKCFKEIEKLKEPKFFKSWFFKILIRTGVSIAKKNSNVIPVEINSDNENIFFYNNDYENNEINDYEVKTLLIDALNNLSENLRTVAIPYYYNDMSIEEISKITGCFKATVKSRLFYARTLLKKQLAGSFSNGELVIK